jgi:hypothetical protein
MVLVAILSGRLLRQSPSSPLQLAAKLVLSAKDPISVPSVVAGVVRELAAGSVIPFALTNTQKLSLLSAVTGLRNLERLAAATFLVDVRVNASVDHARLLVQVVKAHVCTEASG